MLKATEERLANESRGRKEEVGGGDEEGTSRALSLWLPLGPWGEKGRVMLGPELEQSLVLGNGRSFISSDLEST